jgi:hypothetical protein
MNKLSVAAIVLSLMSAAPAYQASAAPASSSEKSVSDADQAKINDIVAEIEAAAASGDEQLVAKLLESAVKANPDLATKIVAVFVDKQTAANKTASNTTKTIDLDKVVGDVVANLQTQPGGDKLVAAVLNSYTPAAGGDKKNNNNNNNNNKDNKPDPKDKNNNGFGGDNNKDKNKDLPKENKNQNSPK